MPSSNNKAYFYARARNERALAGYSADAAKRRIHEVKAMRFDVLARGAPPLPILRGHEVSPPEQGELPLAM